MKAKLDGHAESPERLYWYKGFSPPRNHLRQRAAHRVRRQALREAEVLGAVTDVKNQDSVCSGAAHPLERLMSLDQAHALTITVQARKEHEMLEALLLEDAIAAAPSYLQPPLAERHSLLPFADTRELRKRSKEIKRSSCEVAEKLWHALLASDTKHVSQLADELEPHELAVCARWKRRDLATDLVQEVDEATPPARRRSPSR